MTSESPRQKPRTTFEAMSLITSLGDNVTSFSLRVVCQLGVADLLIDGPRDAADLAEATGTHAPSLVRLLRVMVARGVFEEPKRGWFGLTAAGELLWTGHPYSMRWTFRMFPDVTALAELGHTVRTGEPAFDHVFGQSYFSYLAGQPELRRQFHEGQHATTRLDWASELSAHQWPDRGTIVDLGGGDGSLLALVLAVRPRLRGVLFDLPDTVAAAPEVLDRAGVAGRCEIVAGDLLIDPVPEGHGTYITKRVLLGMGDENAVRLLCAARRAMRPDSRLLLFEPMQQETSRVLSATLDLRTLALSRGRVRSEDEFANVVAMSGLRVTQVTAMRLLTVIEAQR